MYSTTLQPIMPMLQFPAVIGYSAIMKV